jgi:hypothetical protein
MSRLSLQQARGLKDLIQETVEAGASAIEKVHQDIACQPFAVLKKINVIAVPVQAIETVHQTITGGVYTSVRTVNRIAGVLATQVLNRLEEHGDTAEGSQAGGPAGDDPQYPAVNAPRRRLSE